MGFCLPHSSAPQGQHPAPRTPLVVLKNRRGKQKKEEEVEDGDLDTLLQIDLAVV